MSRIAMPVRIVFVLLISTIASAADAQTKPRVIHTAPRRAQPVPRAYVLGGVSFLFGDGDFTDHRTIKTNAEDGSFDAAYTNPNSTGFEVAGGVRLWKYLGARIGVAHYAATAPPTSRCRCRIHSSSNGHARCRRRWMEFGTTRRGSTRTHWRRSSPTSVCSYRCLAVRRS